jgi:hypothetical protein
MNAAPGLSPDSSPATRPMRSGRDTVGAPAISG